MTNIFGKKIENISPVDAILIGFVVIGIVLTVISLFRGILVGNQAQIEYINSENDGDRAQGGTLSIDIEGAVISSGVYELPEGSRIKDILIAAGGYSDKADRVYCEKNLNLAQLLKDGEKIYIPSIGNTPGSVGYAEPKLPINTVNLNTATISELDTLWGVGAVRAETIVKNRPYNSLDEVVSKGGMTKQIFEKNKDKLMLF